MKIDPKTSRLVKRAKRLLRDLEEAGLKLTLNSPGGQPHAYIHTEDVDLEYDDVSKAHHLGTAGVGDMIAR